MLEMLLKDDTLVGIHLRVEILWYVNIERKFKK